jgi:hypothetical protein
MCCERLDDDWSAEDVMPLINTISDTRSTVSGTWSLVDHIGIRNDANLRNEVPARE